MKFSIITVCFNSEKTIRRTLESMKNQTFTDFEYIIIDGKSTDGTLSIVDEYRDFFGDKLTVVSEPDTGIYNAMNKGIRMAKGDIVGIINSDDCYENTALESMAKAYDGGAKEILYGLARVYIDDVESEVILSRAEFLDKKMLYHPACFVTRDVYTTYGGFDEQYRTVADYDFMLRMRDNGDVKFIPVYSIIAGFYGGGVSDRLKSKKESLLMQKNRGMIGPVKYCMKMFNAWINKVFGVN